MNWNLIFWFGTFLAMTPPTVSSEPRNGESNDENDWEIVSQVDSATRNPCDSISCSLVIDVTVFMSLC